MEIPTPFPASTHEKSPNEIKQAALLLGKEAIRRYHLMVDEHGTNPSLWSRYNPDGTGNEPMSLPGSWSCSPDVLAELRKLIDRSNDDIVFPGAFTWEYDSHTEMFGIKPFKGDMLSSMCDAFSRIAHEAENVLQQHMPDSGWNPLVEVLASTIPLRGPYGQVLWRAPDTSLLLSNRTFPYPAIIVEATIGTVPAYREALQRIVDWLYGLPEPSCARRGIVMVLISPEDEADYYNIKAWEAWMEEWEVAPEDFEGDLGFDDDHVDLDDAMNNAVDVPGGLRALLNSKLRSVSYCHEGGLIRRLRCVQVLNIPVEAPVHTFVFPISLRLIVGNGDPALNIENIPDVRIDLDLRKLAFRLEDALARERTKAELLRSWLRD